MTVKILKSYPNFKGIHYNEGKRDQMDAGLLVAANFQGMLTLNEGVTKADYIHYMEAISSLNKRVTNKQFHATISTKGQSHSYDQLKEIGIQYLNEMGYGQNPYLIYSHHDTNNNHIHLVSTRVRKDGQKVDDSYEKIRSQSIMDKILQREPKVESLIALTEALSYHFSNSKQFALILEQQGFNVRLKEGVYEVIKYGRVQSTIEEQEIQRKISDYVADKSRQQQIKALLIKYSSIRPEDYQSYLREKLGIQLVMHFGKGSDTPYGYTVIDHKNKNVYKGSAILPLTNLLNPSLSSEDNKFKTNATHLESDTAPNNKVDNPQNLIKQGSQQLQDLLYIESIKEQELNNSKRKRKRK